MTRGTPPLLPWQPCLLAAIAGILARHAPIAALAGLGLLATFPRPAPGRPRLVQLLGAFVLGLGVAWLAMPEPPGAIPPCVQANKRLNLTGRVVSVTARPGGRLSCLLDETQITGSSCDQTPLPGRLSLTLDVPAFRPIPGDILAVTSKLRPTRGFSNPGVTDFAFLRRLDDVFYRAYARGTGTAVRLVRPSPNSFAHMRERLRQQVAAKLLPPTQTIDTAPPGGRAMVMALVFGDRSGFTNADLDRLRRASLAHTLALSGMHVSNVALLGFLLVWLAGQLRPQIFLWLPRARLAILVGLPLVIGYAWLGGYSPSLYRAVLMFAGCGLLLFFGRHLTVLDSLFLALAGLLVMAPLLAYDVRLQLSALAVAGIGLFWPPFATVCARLRLPRGLRLPILFLLGILWTSLCAEVVTMPLIVRLFGDWNVNPWINVLWLPILGLVVTPLALIGTMLVPWPMLSGLGGHLLLAAAWCCQEMLRLLAALDARGLLISLPVLRPAWPEGLGCLGLLACLALMVSGRRQPTTAVAVSLALLLGPTVWRAVGDTRDTVRLTVFDVGQGQSVALTLPGGRRILVDGGGLLGNFDVGQAVIGSSLTDDRPPRLEAVMASHPHLDHIKGLISILQRFTVGTYYDNGGIPEGNLARPIESAIARRHIPHITLAAGDHLDLGHGLALQVLHPGPTDDRDGNNGSLILRLTWHGRGLAVIPGDAERRVLARLAGSGVALAATVLVLPHHGSTSSLSYRFHQAVNPRLAIASSGNRRYYPGRRVVESLLRLSCPTLATKNDGAITVRFDGPTAPPIVETMRAHP